MATSTIVKAVLGGMVGGAILTGAAVALAGGGSSASEEDEPQPRPPAEPLRGEGSALYRAGDTVVVASDTGSELSASFLSSVRAELEKQAPDIRWLSVPLPVGADGTVSLASLANAVNTVPEAPSATGALVLWSPEAKTIKDQDPATFGTANFVEVPPDGEELSPEEVAFLRANRSPTSRLFGLTSSRPHEPIAPFVNALLTDLRNPAGLPADRTV